MTAPHAQQTAVALHADGLAVGVRRMHGAGHAPAAKPRRRMGEASAQHPTPVSLSAGR